MTIEASSLDVFLNILRYVAVEDILNLRETCKQLNALTYERSVWFDALYIHVVAEGFPVPHLAGREISSLSSTELERITRKILRFRRNWTSESPIPTDLIRLAAVAPWEGRRPRVLALYILPGRGNRYLISLTLQDQGSQPRAYNVDCWDLLASTPCSVATFRCNDLFSTIVNSDPEHRSVLAITRRTDSSGSFATTMFGLDFTCTEPRNAFKPLLSFPSYKHSVALNGSTYLASDESHHVRVFDVDNGALRYVLHAPLAHDDPTVQLDEFRCLSSLIYNQFVLIFRQQWIHIYHLPPLHAANATKDGRNLFPVAAHKWPWRVDTMTVLRQRPHPLLPQFRRDAVLSDDPPSLICLLLRFDSWFPWPVNILHQFILPPNPLYKPGTCTTQADDGSSHLTELPYLAPPASAFELAGTTPNHLKPYLVSSIPSPIRIFTPSDTVLGSYGTAVWLDAQTDSTTPAQAGDRGQRVAGKALHFVPPPQMESEALPRHAMNLEVGGGVSSAFVEERPGNDVVVFHTQVNDNWGKLAVCDEEGRIIIGTTDGQILVYEYA